MSLHSLPTVDDYYNDFGEGRQDDENDSDDNDDDLMTKRNTQANSFTSPLSPKFAYKEEDDDQEDKKPRLHIEYKEGDEKLTEKSENDKDNDDKDDDDDDSTTTYISKFDDEDKELKTERGGGDNNNDDDVASTMMDEDEDEDDFISSNNNDDEITSTTTLSRRRRREYGEEEFEENDEDNNDEGSEIADDDEYEDEKHFQKFRDMNRQDYISKTHPECLFHCMDEIAALVNVIRDEKGNVVDPLHRTIPLLTKYERARVLGVRAKQLEDGAEPFVDTVPEKMIDSYHIAEYELKQKKLPFIIRRPLSGGGMEYWRINDLENLLSE
jgi:DNA-directed RNA polymerase subunit K/omega